ncbi:MAG: hypothetical protein R2854_12095 [Caldilineaceae bacterium]
MATEMGIAHTADGDVRREVAGPGLSMKPLVPMQQCRDEYSATAAPASYSGAADRVWLGCRLVTSLFIMPSSSGTESMALPAGATRCGAQQTTPAGRVKEACIDEDAERVSDVIAPHAALVSRRQTTTTALRTASQRRLNNHEKPLHSHLIRNRNVRQYSASAKCQAPNAQ